MRSGTLSHLHNASDISIRKCCVETMRKARQAESKAEFVVLDDIGEQAYNWLCERELDCDYSRSRETAYIGGDKEVDHLVLINIDGLVLNLSEPDFEKFKLALGLMECVDISMEDFLVRQHYEEHNNSKLIKQAIKNGLLTGELSDIGKIQKLSGGTADPREVRRQLGFS